MKPPKFEYVRPSTIKEAVAALAAAGDNGKIIAGGQSLVPMLNFRLLSPSVLIDINRIPGLGEIQEQPDGGLKIGALTRHHALETSPVVKRLYPVLHAAMQHVAHLAIRNRGTIGGSITHADPAAELPMMMKLLDASITLVSSKGTRIVEADDFFLGALTADVEENELVAEINLPPLPQGAGWAFEEVARRAGDFALAAAGVVMHVEQGKVAEARIGVMGVADTPVRINDAETILFNQAFDPAILEEVVQAVVQAVEPSTDLHASAEYRLHLIEVLIRRTIIKAWQRATGEIDE